MDDSMFSPQQGATRAVIDHLAPAEIQQLQNARTIIADSDRHRPRYFDGRFLAAPDLTREQNYFLARQGDLARASTAGVIHGLEVMGVDDTTLQIQPGNGVTPTGEMVVLTDPLTVDLGDVAGMQTLDSAFGLEGIPNEPIRRRSGLYVLALRPVEYTANPIAAYPTSVTARRAVEDGELIEAVAATLIPYPDDQAEINPQRLRAHAAHRIFIDGPSDGILTETLPIAMLQLDRGFLTWIDPYLVRREVGPEHGGVAGFGLISRAAREAHVLQYQQQLDDVIADRAESGAVAPRFAAAEIFSALPSAGKMPIETIDRLDVLNYKQLYFPPQMRVLMSLVPEDEIAAHVEESLMLPPIDLTATSDELAFTWVLVLLPAARGDLFLPEVTRMVELAPATPGIVTRGLPIDVPGRLFPTTTAVAVPTPAAATRAAQNEKLMADTFAQARAAGHRLWFVRRRALRIKTEHRYQVRSIDVGHVHGKRR